MPVITVKILNYAGGIKTTQLAEGELPPVTNDCKLMWIDLQDPSPTELQRAADHFTWHQLAVEDATVRHQRPKLDIFDDYQFIVFYALEIVDQRPVAHEISMFAGENYVVTIHTDAMHVIAETAQRWNDNVVKNGMHGPGLLVYSLLDAIVDGYFPVLDSIADTVEDLEEAVFSGKGLSHQKEVFRLKKELMIVRRIVGPEREVMNSLVRRDAPLFNDKEITYFQDVYDHLLRITDSIDAYRDLLSSVLDASLSMTSFRLNETVKTMTSSTIVLMSVTLVAGIYGMNFVNMPELQWTYGYPFALLLMVLIGGGLIVILRKIDWL